MLGSARREVSSYRRITRTARGPKQPPSRTRRPSLLQPMPLTAVQTSLALPCSAGERVTCMASSGDIEGPPEGRADGCGAPPGVCGDRRGNAPSHPPQNPTL
ncbi:hypothetical protein E2C01_055422 [Portunus trituberculatus]|uniref:Uncharacterized protein n=1 Tax=Portunus trituberculatus TaxID=210409 RepID=A0A5B7GR53_PORTR|nr:hypothetical protein [Portunus trituberculatus]